MMNRKTTIPGGTALVDECASAIQEKYKTGHYDVQRSICQEKGTLSILVKINAATSTRGRILRSLTGMHVCADLKLTPVGANLDVTVLGGMWWDKLFAAVMCCVGLWWLLLIPMLLGIIQQKKLHEQVYKDTLQWLDSRKAWLGEEVVRIRAT